MEREGGGIGFGWNASQTPEGFTSYTSEDKIFLVNIRYYRDCGIVEYKSYPLHLSDSSFFPNETNVINGLISAPMKAINFAMMYKDFIILFFSYYQNINSRTDRTCNTVCNRM